MSRERDRLDIPSLREWKHCRDDLSKAARKRIAKQYMQDADRPRVEASEREWLQEVLISHPPRGMGIAADLCREPIPLQYIRGWAQLRLQGQFTDRARSSGWETAQFCAACGEATPPSAKHLLSECGAMSTAVAQATAATPWATLSRDAIAERLWAPHSAEDIPRMVQLCGRIQSAYASCDEVREPAAAVLR